MGNLSIIYNLERILLLILIITWIIFKIMIKLYIRKYSLKNEYFDIRNDVVLNRKYLILSTLLTMIIITSIVWIISLSASVVGLKFNDFVNLFLGIKPLSTIVPNSSSRFINYTYFSIIILIILVWILFFAAKISRENNIYKVLTTKKHLS